MENKYAHNRLELKAYVYQRDTLQEGINLQNEGRLNQIWNYSYSGSELKGRRNSPVISNQNQGLFTIPLYLVKVQMIRFNHHQRRHYSHRLHTAGKLGQDKNMDPMNNHSFLDPSNICYSDVHDPSKNLSQIQLKLYRISLRKIQQ